MCCVLFMSAKHRAKLVCFFNFDKLLPYLLRNLLKK